MSKNQSKYIGTRGDDHEGQRRNSPQARVSDNTVLSELFTGTGSVPKIDYLSIGIDR